MSNDKPGVVVTRWWWVRHAPVRSDGGNIYGQKDIECDCSDREVFEAVAKILPRNAVWYSSNLKRTHQTAEAIWATGFPKPANMTQEISFAEQNLGKWQGMNRKEFIASLPLGRHWLTEVDEPAPGGESFMDLYNRTCNAIAAHHRGRSGQGRHRGRPWWHDPGRGRPCARRVAGAGPCLRHRQLLGDAARSHCKCRAQCLAAADGQSAAMDGRCRARRHASARGAGGRADQTCVTNLKDRRSRRTNIRERNT